MNGKIFLFTAALFAAFGVGAAQAADDIGGGGDPVAGKKVFHTCHQCHHIGRGATNFYGPVLNGLIGRKAGTVHGYRYSDAILQSGKVWDIPTLKSYLHQPQHDVPNTDMTFRGLKNDKDIDDVLAYIGEFNSSGARKRK